MISMKLVFAKDVFEKVEIGWGASYNGTKSTIANRLIEHTVVVLMRNPIFSKSELTIANVLSLGVRSTFNNVITNY